MHDIKNKSEMVADDFQWEDIPTFRGNGVGADSVIVSYKFPEKNPGSKVKPLLTIKFGKNVLDHLGVKLGDKVLLKQAKDNIYNYLIMKGTSGHIISEGTTPNSKLVNIRFLREGLNLFKNQECKFYATAKGVIRLVLPQVNFPG